MDVKTARLLCFLVTLGATLCNDVSQKNGGVNLTEELLKMKEELSQLIDTRLNAVVIVTDRNTDHNDFQKSNPPQNGGGTFVRWGRKSCPENGTEMVYTGYVGGSHNTHAGGAANFLCMPKDPIWPTTSTTSNAYVYGTEYQERFSTFSANVDDDVACSFCRSTTRASVHMIPARNKCYAGWTMEYHGWLMADHYGYKASTEYICVDSKAEAVNHGYASTNERMLYRVGSVCGSLPCPPYVGSRILACVVCTK